MPIVIEMPNVDMDCITICYLMCKFQMMIENKIYIKFNLFLHFLLFIHYLLSFKQQYIYNFFIVRKYFE